MSVRTRIALPRRLTLAVVLGGVAAASAVPAVAATSHTAYVLSNCFAQSATPLDLATNTMGTGIPVGPNPFAVAITPNGKTAYVVNENENLSRFDTVTPVDTATNTAGTPIQIGDHLAGPVRLPTGVAITPDGKTAYVTDFGRNSSEGGLTPIDIATNTPGTRITVTNSPRAVAITPDGKTAYVTQGSGAGVVPIDLATNTVGATIPTGGSLPGAIAITPDGKTAYVGHRSGLVPVVTPIDVATNTAGTPITVGPNTAGIAITSDGKTAYVTNQGSSSVTPIDTATNTAGAAIAVGLGPQGVAITPDGKTAYVARIGGATAATQTVTPINTATNTVGTPIEVACPGQLAITPDQPPVAAFSATAAAAGQPSSFDASASSDPDGSVASYHWDFGDGSSETTTSATTTHTYTTPSTYPVTLTVTDDEGCSTTQTFTGQTVSCNGSAVAQTSHEITVPSAFSFTGFFAPVDNPPTVNQVKAGSSIPVKFSLGGDQGLDVLADGYPKVERYACDDVEDVDPIEQTTTANQGLTYDALTDTYSYVWKTDKAWRGKCATLTVKLDDGSEHTALFQLK